MDSRWRKIGDRWRLELFVDEQPVSWLTLLRKTIRVGSSPVSAGGIAGVGTDEQHRGRGYASQGLRLVVEEMQQRGYALGLLYGISDFYGRFGFVTVDPVATVVMEVDEALRHTRAYCAVRKYRKTKDRNRLARFYNRQNLNRTGTAIRSGLFIGQRRYHKLLAVDHRGALAGYAFYGDEAENGVFQVWEIEAEDAAGYSSLVLTLAKQAKKLKAAKISFWLLPNHPFTDFCVQYRCHYTRFTNRNGGGMARIIDLEALVQQLLPELQRRWLQSRNSFAGVVKVRTDLGDFKLELAKGKVRLGDRKENCTVSIPQQSLTQLIMGYRSLGNVSLDENVEIPKAAFEILDLLFPATGCRGTWAADQF